MVRLDIDDRVLRLALEHVVVAAGYRLVLNPAVSAVGVTDCVPQAPRTTDVFVAANTPLGATIGLGALLGGRARSLILADDPVPLPRVIEALDRGMTCVPTSLLQRAALVPRLTMRQHAILGCMAGGITHDSAIAAAVGLSGTTVKRGVAELCDVLAVGGRADLASAARTLGFVGTVPTRASVLAMLPAASR